MNLLEYFLVALIRALKPNLAPAAPARSGDNFEFALEYVFPNEGGFSDNPSDTGGATNFGITHLDLARWRKHDVTTEDVRSMGIEEARAIYQAWYWHDVGLDLIKNRDIATAVFDMGILTGQQTSIMYAQLAANNTGAQLVVDGVVGPLTLDAFEKVDLKKFLLNFNALLKSHFRAIVARNEKQSVNLAGWINRADRLLTLEAV